MSVGRVLDNNHGLDKRAAFDADITYVTASDLAWLYLSDNTSVMNVDQLVCLKLHSLWIFSQAGFAPCLAGHKTQ